MGATTLLAEAEVALSALDVALAGAWKERPPLETNLHRSVTIDGPSNRPGGTDAGGDTLDFFEDHRRAPRAEATERRARRRPAALALRARRSVPEPPAVQDGGAGPAGRDDGRHRAGVGSSGGRGRAGRDRRAGRGAAGLDERPPPHPSLRFRFRKTTACGAARATSTGGTDPLRAFGRNDARAPAAPEGAAAHFGERFESGRGTVDTARVEIAQITELRTWAQRLEERSVERGDACGREGDPDARRRGRRPSTATRRRDRRGTAPARRCGARRVGGRSASRWTPSPPGRPRPTSA